MSIAEQSGVVVVVVVVVVTIVDVVVDESSGCVEEDKLVDVEPEVLVVTAVEPVTSLEQADADVTCGTLPKALTSIVQSTIVPCPWFQLVPLAK